MSRFFPNYDENKITSKFGNRTVKGVPSFHNGIDLVARVPDGSSAVDYITAHTGGSVQSVGYDKSAGNYIKIQVSPDTIMVYYHLKEKSGLKVGSVVKTGQIIGYMGSTGNSTGAHLHWGIKKDGKWIDPEPYLDKDYLVQEAKATQTYVTVKLPVLKKGAKGNQVKALQALLIGYGYKMTDANGTAYGVDGSFGGATERAVKAYQKANGMTVDGSCGPATWNKLLGVK
jgi:hypothetical protein